MLQGVEAVILKTFTVLEKRQLEAGNALLRSIAVHEGNFYVKLPRNHNPRL
jgi:hypothetical protein